MVDRRHQENTLAVRQSEIRRLNHDGKRFPDKKSAQITATVPKQPPKAKAPTSPMKT